MEKFLQNKLKSVLYQTIIINEWISCGEFEKADRIVFVGNRFEAVVTNFLFRKSKKKVYYCIDFREKYKYDDKTKWIIFNNEKWNVKELNSYDILVVPKL